MSIPTEDLDRIMTLMACSFDPAFGEAWTRRQVEDALSLGNCRYLLVTSDRRPAGANEEAVGFSLSRTAHDEEELLLFAVSPLYRRRGIGRYILDSLVRSARERGIRRLFLEMRQDNPAEALYLASGFDPVGRRPDYYRRSDGQRVDAITFARSIK